MWLVCMSAFAWDGPRVPEDALAAVPSEVYGGWVEREAALDALEQQIAEARVALVEAVDPAADLQAMARTELEVSRLAYARARFELDAALAEEEAARLGLRLAQQRGEREELDGARARIERAVAGRNDARRRLADARRTRARLRREAVPVVEVAVVVEEPELSEGEVLRLEARRDVLAAELERDQARAAVAAGAALDLSPFEEALRRARAVLPEG